MSQSDVLREQRALVENIARSLANLSPALSAADIAQYIYLRWLEKWDEIEPFLEEGQEGMLTVVLRGLGRNYVKKELRQLNGPQTRPDDIYYYSRKQLQEILPLVESPEAWSSFAAKASDGGPSGKQDPALGNNALAMYADLRSAWDSLGEPARATLRLRYVEGLEYPQLALLLDVSEDVVRKRVERGVTAMQKFLGGAARQEAPVRRRAMSRAAAEVVTRGAYDGA